MSQSVEHFLAVGSDPIEPSYEKRGLPEFLGFGLDEEEDVVC